MKKARAASTVHLTMMKPLRFQVGWPVAMYIAKHSTPASSSRPKTRRKISMAARIRGAHQAGASAARPAGARVSSSKVTMS